MALRIDSGRWYFSTRLRRGSLGLVVAAALCGILMLASCVSQEGATLHASAADPAPSGIDFSGRVTSTVDGDTFRISSQNVSIRVWGLDAPETDQLGGPGATSALKRLISGKILRCRQRDVDSYGRIVGQCFLPDGRDITAAMIDSGTAIEYCRFSGDHYRTCRT